MHLTADIQLHGEGAAGRELAGQMLIVRMVDLSGREDDMKIEEVYSTALVRSFFFRDRMSFLVLVHRSRLYQSTNLRGPESTFSCL